MNHRERIQDLALTVNGGLAAYIAVHNTIFEEAASGRSFMKNLSGRGVPMSTLLYDAESLVPLWNGISNQIGAFRLTQYQSLSSDERDFFDILSRYVDALQKTVRALVSRQRLMNEGAKGGRENPMTWRAYTEKEALYQQAISEYIAIGEELNASRSVVFDEEIDSVVSLNAQCASVFTIVSRTVLDDDHWRAFGYKKCPHRHKIFQGFVSTSKLERETALLRELWAASFSAIFRWAAQHRSFLHADVFVAKLMEYVVDGLGESLWPVFRFVTRRDAIDFLRSACIEYGSAKDNDQPQVFLNRCMEGLSSEVPRVWVVGATWLFKHPNSYVFNSGFALSKAGIAENYDCDVEVNDSEYLSIADELFEYTGMNTFDFGS